MNKNTITFVIAAHLVLCWTSVALRIDRFPLTWAPMYSVYTPPRGETYRIPVRDRAWLKKHGWLATLRDGSQRWINQRDLNLPTRNMWRLYYQRTHGQGPPKYKHMNHDAGTFDRKLFGLAPGEKYVEIDWQRRLLTSINKTLAREVDASNFVTRIEARGARYVFDGESLAFLGTAPDDAVASWDESWTDAY